MSLNLVAAPRSRRVAGSLAALLVLVAALAVPARDASGATWTQPSFVRSIGGIGRPGVFAWGLAFNPITREVLVGDYLNFKVRRYGNGGARAIGDLPAPPQGGEVWAVSVDPTNGDIYYSVSFHKALHRYDSAGNYLGTVKMPSGWAAWFDIDHAGDIWVVLGGPQSQSFTLQRYRRDGTLLNSWKLPNDFPKKMTIFGVGVSRDDEVYLPDSRNKQIQVYDFGRNTGSLTLDRTFGSNVLGGDLRGIAIDDANRWVYTSDANANRVRKFRFNGTYLQGIGGPGNEPGRFYAPRQLDVDPATGELYVADYGNWRFQRFSPDGTLIKAYPDPAQPAANAHLGHATDVTVDPRSGDVWVADKFNQRFQRFGADGSWTGSWGFRGGTQPYGQNYPSTIGFDRENRRVWVGQEEARTIKIYDASGAWVHTISSGPKSPDNAGYTRNVSDIDFFNGRAYIADEYYDKIKVVDARTFAEIREIDVYDGAPWSGNHGLGIEPSTGNLFIANYTEDRVKVYSPNGTFLYAFGSRGSQNGQFSSPRDVAFVDGLAYVTDAVQSRVQVFTPDGTFVGKWGGLGTNPMQFRNPMGIDAVGNLLYVSDVENGRVSVFDTSTPKPPFVFHKPNVTISSPSDGAAVDVSGPLTIRGTASSTQKIANVEVKVQRLRDGRWWNGRNSSWEAGATVNLAPWTAPDAPAGSVAFAFAFPGVERGESYRIEVVGRNRHGTASDVAVATVRVAS
jgi:DNA-binding beta-propeller fold protein YncE